MGNEKRSFEVYSSMNMLGFVVTVAAEDYDRAMELAWKGFDMWNDPEEYPEYYDLGYTEPSRELLDEAGIEYEISDIDWDDDEDTEISQYESYMGSQPMRDGLEIRSFFDEEEE